MQLGDQLSTSTPLQIFSVSTSLLIIALVGLVWARAVRWSFLDTMPLNRVEFEHPHLPSIRNILFQCIAFVCVTAAVLITNRALWSEPFRLVEVLGPLLLITTVGISTELHSLRARVFGISLSLGTAIGMALASLFTLHSAADAITSILLLGATALILALQLQTTALMKRWPPTAHFLLLITAALWFIFLRF